MTFSPIRLGWIILSAALYVLIAYNIPRQQFGAFFGLNTLLFWGYWLRIQPLISTPLLAKEYVNASPDHFLFGAAILFRLLLLVAPPQLSDDYARFIWDGRLLTHGYNPYLYLPSQLLNTPVALVAGLDQSLFATLNSPDYFTVYPPVNQALFALSAWASPHSLPGAIFWLRVPIILAECGSIWLLVQILHRLGQNPNGALLYALNPLIILELTGNVHFEAVMIFFSLLAVWLLVPPKPNWLWSAGALALAIGTKLLPLLLLPVLVRYLGWQRGLRYALLTGILTLLLFLPAASMALVQNMGASLNLYFQKFEFNASVYYLVRMVGYWVKGYNIIAKAGFWLPVVSTLSILWLAFTRRPIALPVRVLASLTVYYAFSTTVHPWYATTLVATAVFTRLRYPLIWSGLIPLSYAAYSAQPYQENLTLTALEYGLVLVVGIWDWQQTRRMAAMGVRE